MVRFSNSKLSSTRHIVRGITGGAVTPIPASATPRRTVSSASDYTAAKSAIGVSSTAYDVALDPGMPDSNVDLGLLYSNGYRYKYINFRAGTTGCSVELPDKVVTIEVPTDAGPIYVDQTISGYRLITAYVGNNIVVPQQPNPNIPTNATPAPSKLPHSTNNNNC